MVIPITLIILGLLTQVIVLVLTRNKMPRFTSVCQDCGYKVPLMEHPPALLECPECHRLSNINDPPHHH